MKLIKKPISAIFISLIVLGHHTQMNALKLPSFGKFKFWSSGKEEVVSLTEIVEPGCNITVSNLNGNVSVKTWRQEKVIVEAKKHGSEKALDSTSIKKRYAKNELFIETISQDKKTKCSVDYEILVPESSRLRSINTNRGKITITNVQHGVAAKTSRGEIVVENTRGWIKTNAERGSITIASNDFDAESKILAVAGKGNINLALPSRTNANVFCKTAKGYVNSEVPITTKSRTMKFNSKTLAELKREALGVIGEGGSSIKLHTGRGNIKIVEA
jgi:hypothetical protein